MVDHMSDIVRKYRVKSVHKCYIEHTYIWESVNSHISDEMTIKTVLCWDMVPVYGYDILGNNVMNYSYGRSNNNEEKQRHWSEWTFNL